LIFENIIIYKKDIKFSKISNLIVILYSPT
jgi:hypothetical protein